MTGDGANDVPMIQEAHVGVGIAGMEGMQVSLKKIKIIYTCVYIYVLYVCVYLLYILFVHPHPALSYPPESGSTPPHTYIHIHTYLTYIHIHIHIDTQKTTQAVNSSDFAIAQFRFLAPLLLAHGEYGSMSGDMYV